MKSTKRDNDGFDHVIKILPRHYRDVVRDLKRAELRHDDRKYKVGDVVSMEEWDAKKGRTGNRVIVQITHVCKDKPVPRHHAMLSIEVLTHTQSE